MGGGSLHDKVRDQPQPPEQAAEMVDTLAAPSTPPTSRASSTAISSPPTSC